MDRRLRIGILLALTLAPTLALAEAQAQTDKAQPQAEVTQEQTETVQEKGEASLEENGEAEAGTQQDPKVISGMSILGNQEAPKSLVIVPWKSSEIGNAMDISTMLDDSRQPVDREVFLRALSYYEIRSEKEP